MGDKVFLVHGWSVQETTTYQALHLQLAQHGFELVDIFLGRYVSLEDKVEIRDIAKAMHLALEEQLGGDWSRPFHLITHSTGALVVRHWVANHYREPLCAAKPLQNLVFLAGPHFGSRLAHHGRSMLAHARYLGDTGTQVLTALELGSRFSWESADAWLDPATWRAKGIRPFCLIGDRVKKRLADRLAAKVMPAAFEPGSDMVVRCAAGNLNFARYELHADTGGLRRVGGIDDVPYAALADYLHSGPEHGIMNSIRKASSPETHQALGLILQCLGTASDADYAARRAELADVTAATRQRRPGFAQLDFRFRDEADRPIDDYAFKLGWIDPAGRQLPSEAVHHTHKNLVDPNHFTVFLETRQFDPSLCYFIEFDARSGSELFSYQPDPFHIRTSPQADVLAELVREDRTTQIDVVLSRQPNRNLFVFHRGDDKSLHVRWDRKGEITKKRLKVK